MRRMLLGAAFVFFSGMNAFANPVSMQDKIALQATMAGYIDLHLVDGVIPHVMLDSGEIVDLVPSKSHPMVVSLGSGYVLCTDFRDPEGKFVNVDFYVKRDGERFVIFQTEIDNRDPLKKLVEAGKASMVE